MLNTFIASKSLQTNKADFESIPLNPAHRWLFAHFPPPFEWFDSLSFTLSSPVSIGRVEKTIQALVIRHASLRTTFFHDGDEWRQQVHSVCPDSLFKPLWLEGENQPIEKLQLEICKSFQISKLPLFKVVVMAIGKDHFNFHIIFHHIIVDYLSVMIFMKEFYHLYYKENVFLSEPISSLVYAKEVATLLGSMTQENREEYLERAEFKNSHSSTTNWLGISQNNQRPSKELQSQYLEKGLSEESSAILLRSAKSHFQKISLHPILVAPLYRAIQKISRQPSVTISHKLNGRELRPHDTRFFSTIGNFAINAPICSEVFPNEPWDHLIDRLDRRFHENPAQHLLYDLLGSQLPESRYPDHWIAPVRFNFMGTMSFYTPPFLNLDFRTFAKRVKVDDQILTTYIEFFVYFSESKLWIETIADSSHSESTKILLDQYIEELNALIKFIKGSIL